MQKVHNWFNNRHETKRTRLPFKIKRNWTAASVFAAKESEKISKEAESLAAEDDQQRKPIAFWNAARKDLFDRLPDEQQEMYRLEASSWNASGPGAEWKPM